MKKSFALLLLLLFFPVGEYAACMPQRQEIDTTAYVAINGIEQFITIKGDDKNNPILLFLHGGPGRSLIPFSDGFTDKLRQKFLVVQWDQRETGETRNANPSKEKITVDLLKSDALKMVNYLLQHFNRDKLFLVSHSWGSVMGFDIAQKHPELLYAYIPISPVVDANKSSQLTLDMLKQWAMVINNQMAITELGKVGIPYKTMEDIFYSQKWLFAHNEVEGVLSPEFRTMFYDWLSTWFNVWKDNADSNLYVTAPEIKCPIYFCIGSADNQMYYTIADDYFHFLKADKKQLIWFEHSGHTIFNSEPGKLRDELLRILRDSSI